MHEVLFHQLLNWFTVSQNAVAQSLTFNFLQHIFFVLLFCSLGFRGRRGVPGGWPLAFRGEFRSRSSPRMTGGLIAPSEELKKAPLHSVKTGVPASLPELEGTGPPDQGVLGVAPAATLSGDPPLLP